MPFLKNAMMMPEMMPKEMMEKQSVKIASKGRKKTKAEWREYFKNLRGEKK